MKRIQVSYSEDRLREVEDYYGYTYLENAFWKGGHFQ